ncbi:putative transposase [ISY120a: 851653 - 852454] [Synechocystis sp. LKSZ1]
MMNQCPKCEHQHVIKSGFVNGKQRYKCRVCNYQFTQPTTERGKPLWMKLDAVLLYLGGMSMNAIANHLNVSAQAVLSWIRDFAKLNYEKPLPGTAVVIELDELWHFIDKKRENYGSGKLMTVIVGDLSTGSWEVVIVKP